MAESQTGESSHQNKSVQRVSVPCGPNDAFRLKVTIEFERTPEESEDGETTNVRTQGTDPGNQETKSGSGALGTDPGDLGNKSGFGTLDTKVHF